MALILIVDDSPTEVFVMQKALEKHAFRAILGRRGLETVLLQRLLHDEYLGG